jgi:hypothetical protein
MRNVIYAINITLDGCCDHTKRIGDKKYMNIFGPIAGLSVQYFEPEQ